MKNRTLKEMMDALFISLGLHKTCVEELSLLQKGPTKSFVLLERKRFVKVQDPIPKRIKIGPMTVDCKIRLE